MDKENSKLDPNICMNFRNAINSAPLIAREKKYESLYNLSCAGMDRLDSSVRFLNDHWDYPKKEEDFLGFMVFACILNDGVDRIYRNTIGYPPKCNAAKKYFKEYCMGEPAFISEELCPTDESFFEYIRSLSFAHPFETNRQKTYNALYGKQVSPWVIVNEHTWNLYRFPEPIGVRIYASKKNDGDDIFDIMFSFSALKSFLIEKYSALDDVTQWVKEFSEKVFTERKKIRINREQPPVVVLKEICKALDSRHESTYGIEEIISYLTCHLSDASNKDCVNEYRNYLIGLIPDICDCVDNLDSAGQYELERESKTFYPLGLHKMAYYQLEKIFDYLQERHDFIPADSNEEWGLRMADDFYKEFAHKWVNMDVYNMEYREIKLLVTVSMFMECKAQNRLSLR